MSRNSLLVIAMLSLLLNAACVHQPTPLNLAEGDAFTKRVDSALFDYDQSSFDVEQGQAEDFKNYEVIPVAYSAYFEPENPRRRMVAHFYRQKDVASAPSAVVLPILGGDYAVSKEFARFLALSGYQVLRFERKADFLALDTAPEMQREVIREMIIDVRRGLDWWTKQPGVDPDRLGTLGISMGGVYTTLLLSCEPRIKAGVLLISGCELADLMATTKEIEVVEFRQAVMQREQISLEQFTKLAHQYLDDIDPAAHAAAINPARLLMVTGRFDRVMPFAKADKLYQAAGKPNRIIIPTGHYSSALFLRVIKLEVLRHFAQVFKADGHPI